ncbi:MAG TPA: RDD family protein [Flavisolibacter sp.]|nr:RDD family protein [Flavisolibacter sp.]
MDYQNYSSESHSTDLFPQRTIVYGSFLERFAAAILDGFILIIPSYILQYLMGQMPGFLVSILVNWLYSAYLESGENQATLGKRALSLKVTDMNGHRISFANASGRFFGKYVSAIILCIGYLMMLWDDKKQTLHDKMAGTLVVKS